ncbi:MAG: hypothetical protein M1548_09110 [Actinobacteria bacterium]|nr:hypothetical protein [Actinomycetota bacterium]
MAEIKTRGALLGSLAASVVLTISFYLLATALGRYGKLDIYMASIYVLVLSMIVSASVIPPLLKKRQGGS